MATITTAEGNVSVTMDNGHSVPVRPDWESLSVSEGPKGEARIELISYADDGEVWFTGYDPTLIDGLGRALADGETFTSHDGCAWTRYGDEMVARSAKAAATPAA